MVLLLVLTVLAFDAVLRIALDRPRSTVGFPDTPGTPLSAL
jgi:hypothetical protein